ncbi:MAG: 3-methyladenine DNA glycosylase [Candidatus Moranbacteria bacterium RIFCSPHIGHO2_01_FULL_55_24]|nr:MAG: 3-methyladenine DNA glycosylase [Candidatus Moranbacteria bacterium RIFCSPHIGHO2_01_FULL_55_24]
MAARILSERFYERDTLTAAKELLGCFLVRKIGRKTWRARITEVEAYVGEDDLACHASKGRTKRTETMYGEPGHAYVYLIYGMYHCLNIVTEKGGFPAAVLVRAVEVEDVPKKETDGPGKLCRFLEIDRTFDAWDVTRGEKLWVERGRLGKGEEIEATKRIGVEYAGHCKEYLWRFEIAK